MIETLAQYPPQKLDGGTVAFLVCLLIGHLYFLCWFIKKINQIADNLQSIRSYQKWQCEVKREEHIENSN